MIRSNIFGAVVAAGVVLDPGLSGALGAPFGPAMDQAVIDRTNAYRLSEGRKPLQVDQALSEAAQGFADFYARNPGSRAEWGHEYGGTTLSERVGAAGYEGWCFGENLGWQGTTGPVSAIGDVSAKLLDGWISSPGHQANLIKPEFDEIGVGSATYRAEGFNWVISVQVFGCSDG